VQDQDTSQQQRAASEQRHGEHEPGRIARFLILALELVLIAAIVHLFRIEERRHFFPVLCVIIGGFLIHAWLPMKFRMAFFALLSVGGLVLVLGVANGLLVLGTGGALIGVCYLPCRFGIRLTLMLISVAALITLRVQLPLPVWPVLGSMFMFRLIVYVGESIRQTKQPSLASAVSYFFMLPNVCFPLFPLIDYRTFRDTWYDEDEWDIHQRGVVWIVRGLVHLLIYRYINSYLVPEPWELQDLEHIVLFLVTNNALYLQVSGQFHLITGLLHLFGFNLPRTHHLFFMASSFSDIWRRINIYWKDFMTKFFFFPAFYFLRHRGASLGVGIVLAVFYVFVATWLLHSWQTFWLLGAFPLTANDAFLWLGVGVCVAINALLDARRGKTDSASANRPAWVRALSVSVRTVCMFGLVSLFWACWTRPRFLLLFSGLWDQPHAGRGLSVVLMWILVLVLIGMALELFRGWQSSSGHVARTLTFSESAKLHAVGLGVVLVFGSPWFTSQLDSTNSKAIAAFRSDTVGGGADFGRLRGYYEELNTAEIQAGPLLGSVTPNDQSRQARASGFVAMVREADLLQKLELVPGFEGSLGGIPVSINQFGMRDRRTITIEKPPNTIRIAFVGSSVVMGYAVADNEVYSRLFETGLNARRTDRTRRFEVLNFGVGKQWAINRLVTIRRKVFAFEPDAVYYFAHQDEMEEPANHLAELVFHEHDLPAKSMEAIIKRAGLTADMSWGQMQSRLGRFQRDIVRAVYGEIADECRSRGVMPVWIYLPVPGVNAVDLFETLSPVAEEAGFVVVDLSGWSAGHRPDEVKRSADGIHPDARGHRLITKALLKAVDARPEALPRDTAAHR
jgi:hypothetical protein